MDSRIEEMNSLLRIELGDIRLIGIWGMSGIGKTTLARNIYNRISHQFDISCFLSDVKEHSQTKGLVHLQRELLSKLSMRNMKVHDEYEGKNIIRSLLCCKKVLVVLDDVSETSQLENFPIKQAWLGSGSRVIVTTTNLHILEVHGEFQMYKPKLLNHEESLKLFSKRAFKCDKPANGFLELSESVISHAEGHPLTLEVLGSHLCERTKLEWKDALEKVKKFAPGDILKRLRIHYEALDDMGKKIFLDIACFFKGMAKDEVTKIFEICGFHPRIGIRELVEKCLLIEYYYCGRCYLGMHGILQEMGKTIVFEESPSEAGRRSRLWSPGDIHHVMTKNKGSDLIEVLHLQSPTPCEANWDLDAFSVMCNLRIIIISCDVKLPHGLRSLPSSLKILEWKKYPLKSLPHGAHLANLKMHHSNIIQLWERTQMSENLKFIDLSYSKNLIRTPKFSMLPNLEQLILEGCIELVQIHSSLGQHKKLVVLNLKDCKNLKGLPSRMEMDSLQKLILSGCLKLKHLPEFGETLHRLSVLDVKNCVSLLCLPSSISNLRSLRVLSISGCSKFSSLPQNLGEIECLEELDISGTAIGETKGLTSNPLMNLFSFRRVEAFRGLVLPPSISRLLLLKQLNVRNCNLRVGSIPSELGFLSSLEVLNLSGNNFSNLPTGTHALPPSLFSSLSSLKMLNLSYCHLRDDSIPDDLSGLSSLETLDLSGNNFTKLPARCIFNLLHLRVLYLSHCQRLKILPILPPNLKHIDTVACHSMPNRASFAKIISQFIKSVNDIQVRYPFMSSSYLNFLSWWTLDSEIPPWCYNQNYQCINEICGFRDNHVVQTFEREISCQGVQEKEICDFKPVDSIVSIKVDISRIYGSTKRMGISLCLLLQDEGLAKSDKDVFHRQLLLSCKASSDEFFRKERKYNVVMDKTSHVMMVFYLPCSNVPSDCNHIKFIFYTKKYKHAFMEAESDWQNWDKFIISKCGWRLTCKKDLIDFWAPKIDLRQPKSWSMN